MKLLNENEIKKEIGKLEFIGFKNFEGTLTFEKDNFIINIYFEKEWPTCPFDNEPNKYYLYYENELIFESYNLNNILDFIVTYNG